MTTIGNKRSRVRFAVIAIVCGVGCVLTLPYGLFLTFTGGAGLGLVIAGLILGGVSAVSLYALFRAPSVPGGPLADEAVNLMPPAIQRKPAGWTGYGVSGTASELPESPRDST